MLKASRGFQGREKVKKPRHCLYKKKSYNVKILFAEIILSNITPFIPTSYNYFNPQQRDHFFQLWQLTASIAHTLWHQDTTVTLKQTEHGPVLTIWNTSPIFGPVLSPFSEVCLHTPKHYKICPSLSIWYNLSNQSSHGHHFFIVFQLDHMVFPEMLNNTPVPFAFNSSPGVSYLWICLSSLATEGV